MKKALLFYFFLFTACLSNAQKEPSIQELLHKCNQYLEQYSQLDSYNDGYKFKGLSLPKEDLNWFIQNHQNYEGISAESIDHISLTEHIHEKLFLLIDKVALHPDFFKQKKYRTFHKELNVTTSSDERIISFVLHQKTNSTNRYVVSRKYYLEPVGDSLDQQLTIHHISSDSETSFLDDAIPLDTPNGRMYISTGGSRGCTTCFESYVKLSHFQDSTFHTDFYASVWSRDWNNGVTYNQEENTIEVNYETDDLTETCLCFDFIERNIEQPKATYANSSSEPNTPIICNCQFKFNGSNFELKNINWEKEK